MSDLKFGFALEYITPVRGVDLAGYFHIRANRGVYDDLRVMAGIFSSGGVTGGVVVFDLLGLTLELIRDIRAALREAGIDFGDNLIFSATHSHTGGHTFKRGFGTDEFLRRVVEQCVRAVVRARDNLADAELEFASGYRNDLAFVRRFRQKNGTVRTNPGRNNPEVIRPESEPDRSFNLLAVRQEGRLTALFVNLANHGDSIGGCFVSADWHGRMEREIQHELGHDLPVFALVDASGDINQIDLFHPAPASGGTPADRYRGGALAWGRHYGRIALEMIDELEPVKVSNFAVRRRCFGIPYRVLPAEELEAARRERDSIPADLVIRDDFRLTDPAVRRFFAERTLACADNVGREPYPCELTAIVFNDELVLASLPGEPFHAVSSAIKLRSPFRHTMVVALAQGPCGYIPMPECFAVGGYEPLAIGDSLCYEAADILIEESVKNLRTPQP